MVDDSRTRLLIGSRGVDTLAGVRVLCLGLGGVGGAAAEMLARMGVGHITLADGDLFSPSNINRQLGALGSTIGQSKAEVWQKRCREINPHGSFTPVSRFIRTAEDIDTLLSEPFDAVIDAIDETGPKVDFLCACRSRGIFCVSSMGAGGKQDLNQIRVADISKTSVCPLAKKVRTSLRANGITRGIPCVFSTEQSAPRQPGQPVGSLCYIVCAFGLHLAQTVIDHLLAQEAVESNAGKE